MPTPQRRVRPMRDPNRMPAHVCKDLKALADAIREKTAAAAQGRDTPVVLTPQEARLVWRAMFGDLRG